MKINKKIKDYYKNKNMKR